jgi:nucleoside 2-deoxyribosyltransferase
MATIPRTVYLAGPILGCYKHEANDWRFEVSVDLGSHNIIGISPLRCEPLIGEKYGVGYTDPKFGTARAIAAKNMFDTKTCDMVLAYMPTPPAGRLPSAGTICEIAWGHALGKPVILATDDPFIRDHPVINSCCNWVLDNLEDAVEVAVGILAGYCGGKHV